MNHTHTQMKTNIQRHTHTQTHTHIHTHTHTHTKSQDTHSYVHREKITVNEIRNRSNTHWEKIMVSEIRNHSNTHTHTHTTCCIVTLDRAVNQRCTCVNKQKKKWKQVGVMKEYRQVPAAVELVGQEGQSEGQLTPGWATLAKMRRKC